MRTTGGRLADVKMRGSVIVVRFWRCGVVGLIVGTLHMIRDSEWKLLGCGWVGGDSVGCGRWEMSCSCTWVTKVVLESVRRG